MHVPHKDYKTLNENLVGSGLISLLCKHATV